MHKFSGHKPMGAFFSCEMSVDHRVVLIQNKRDMVSCLEGGMAVSPFLVFVELVGCTPLGFDHQRTGFFCYYPGLLLMAALVFLSRSRQQVSREDRTRTECQ